MCIFIYTLPQLCRHPQFQNVCECAVARGAPAETETSSLTLAEPKFLFDTSRSRSVTPAYYRARFPCKKRKALRPVPTMCAGCLEEQAVRIGTVVVGEKGELVGSGSSSSSSGSGGSSDDSSGGRLAPPVGLLPVSGSASSDMTSGSGMCLSPGTIREALSVWFVGEADVVYQAPRHRDLSGNLPTRWRWSDRVRLIYWRCGALPS